MSTPPRFSIITPTYNHEEFLGACIDSVLAQSYGDWEQIIVDDGSTDRTAEVVRSYCDPRIQYIRQENRGIEALAHTYNRALATAKGSLIAILEGDDTWPADKLQLMMPAFADPDVVLAYGEMLELEPSGRPVSRTSNTVRKHSTLPRSILFNDPVPSAAPYMLTVRGHSLVPASTAVLRRSALEAIGGFRYVPGQCYVDFPTFINLAFQGKFFYLPQIVGYRRMHTESATARLGSEMATVARDYLNQLLAEPRFALQPEQRKAIERDWRRAERSEDLVAGRVCAVTRRWAEARRHFGRAVFSADLKISAAALVGWFLSWPQRDIESLFRLAGRAALDSN